jgi:hypothetical protein
MKKCPSCAEEIQNAGIIDVFFVLALRQSRMKKLFSAVFAVIALSVILPAQAPIDQSRLAGQLQTGTDEQREVAATAILAIPPAARDPSVLSALIQELDRLKQELETRGRILDSGQPLPPVNGEGEYPNTLLDAVAQYEDPVVLRTLISWIASGSSLNAIAAFGELAVPKVLTLASGDSHATGLAFLTLQRMLERPVRNPLSANSRQQIVDLTARRLTGIQPELAILGALSLAAATRDPALIRRVQVIGASASEVQGMGVAETGILRIQNWAKTVLSARGLR